MQVIEANLDRQEDQRDVLAMTSMYAVDVMGNDAPLPTDVLERLISGLNNIPRRSSSWLTTKTKLQGSPPAFLASRPLPQKR